LPEEGVETDFTLRGIPMNLEPLMVEARSFKLLAECYYPPEAGLRGLADDLAGCLVSVCPEAAPHVETMREETAREPDPTPWRVDYAKLFVGPFGVPAPPYGSVYLEGERRVMGGSTIHVRETYREAGLDISEDCCEAPDHIAVELEFMHFLAFKEGEATGRGDREGALRYANMQEEFLERHLGAWVSQFTDLIKAHAETEFYRGLAECTRILVTSRLKGRPEGARPA
jgi:putative dimethyl sulfoxide reductase chaperone